MLVACLYTPVVRPDQAGALTVGVVKDHRDFEEGGCELLLTPDFDKSARYVFMSDLDGRAVMNINGHDKRFRLVRSTESNVEPRKRDRSRYWYASGSITVEVDYTVTGVCPPNDESCEVTYYRAVIYVTSGPLKRSIAAYGLCGV
jgi:hypothetical protein